MSTLTPLTEEELTEMKINIYYPDSVAEMTKYITWLKDVLKNTPTSDISYLRFNKELELGERYVELRTRFEATA